MIHYRSALWLAVAICAVFGREAYLSTLSSTPTRTTSTTTSPAPTNTTPAAPPLVLRSSRNTPAGTSSWWWQRWFGSTSNGSLPAPNGTTFALTSQEFETRLRDFKGIPCTRDQVIRGQWVSETLAKPPYIVGTKHLRCFAKEVYYADSYETYRWQPFANCEFRRYDSDKFCQVTRKKVVAIVGDSLSWEHYRSLSELQNHPTRQSFQHQSRELYETIVQHVCDGQTAILYRRDDRLLNVTLALQSNPDILVLNRGAHFVEDEILLPEIQMVIEEVRTWLDQCGGHCQFFWRTTVPGHPGCGNYTRPMNDIERLQVEVADRSNDWYDEYRWKYHWYDFQRQNELVLEEFRRANLTSFQILDAYHLNVLRPDEHRSHQDDCLHNCYPGKMDVYNQLLLHYLRRDSKKNDTTQTEPSALLWPKLQDSIFDKNATDAAKKIRVDHNLEKELKRQHKKASLQLLMESAGFNGL